MSRKLNGTFGGAASKPSETRTSVETTRHGLRKRGIRRTKLTLRARQGVGILSCKRAPELRHLGTHRFSTLDRIKRTMPFELRDHRLHHPPKFGRPGRGEVIGLVGILD